MTDVEQWAVSTTLKERWSDLSIELQVADVEIRMHLAIGNSANALLFSGRSVKPVLSLSKLPKECIEASSIIAVFSNTALAYEILMT